VRAELRSVCALCDAVFRSVAAAVPHHAALHGADGVLRALHDAALRGTDHVAVVRAANILLNLWTVPNGSPPHDRAVFFLLRLLRESAVLVSKEQSRQWTGYVQLVKTAAASALWHLGPGGPGSGRAAADRVEVFWREGLEDTSRQGEGR